ncbi:Hypothetical predicted protein [Cloeon dipterum]|uniref:Uncharacterized protein n=1 Tax=Cloeon dipterum TaxID=197152 RepID=A0A8S1DF15_9INSE|nr:Hypothetical predicted protein [Cloeon dipterum]
MLLKMDGQHGSPIQLKIPLLWHPRFLILAKYNENQQRGTFIGNTLFLHLEVKQLPADAQHLYPIKIQHG